MVITSNFVYNLKKKSVKRKIALIEIGGVSKSLASNSSEFVIHVPKEYDYRYTSDKKDDIISTLKLAYVSCKKKNLPIYGIESRSLRDYTTTEKDMKRGITRVPEESKQIKGEDLLSSTAAASSSEEEAKLETFASFKEKFNLVEEYTSSFSIKGSKNNSIASDFDFDDMSGQMRKGRSSTVYSRDLDDAVLEDFEPKKVLGKGTFGKVFLVENTKTGEQFAMKSIRKDVILDNEQIESTKLEKHILWTANHPFIIQMAYVFQNETRIYFLLDFVRGGELFKHLSIKKRFTEQ